MPANGVTAHQVPKELRDNAKPVCLVSVDGVVVLHERGLEEICPQPVQLAEAFADKAEKFVVRPFLAAALDNHAWQLLFFSSGQVDPHQLVASFLVCSARHDCKVNGPSEVD